MFQSIDAYLVQLQKELAGRDAALVQDALSDAEEHLRMALQEQQATRPGESERELLPEIIAKYGLPQEIAMAYLEVEALTMPGLVRSRRKEPRSPLLRFLSVASDPGAWGAMLYLLLSVVTGIVYFTWTFSGISLSLAMVLLVIGLPFATLFLLSVRSIGLVEGRIIEALLGTRMPRRPVFTARGQGLWEQVKAVFSDGRTWLTALYMICMLPLGVLYFTVFISLLSLSISFIAAPILDLVINEPLIQLGSTPYYPPAWLMPLVVLAGVITFLATMHLAKAVGKLHASLAKTMLVGGG